MFLSILPFFLNYTKIKLAKRGVSFEGRGKIFSVCPVRLTAFEDKNSKDMKPARLLLKF